MQSVVVAFIFPLVTDTTGMVSVGETSQAGLWRGKSKTNAIRFAKQETRIKKKKVILDFIDLMGRLNCSPSISGNYIHIE